VLAYHLLTISRHTVGLMHKVFILLAIAPGCFLKSGTASDSPFSAPIVELTLDDGSTLETVDVNGDGTPDIFNYLRESETTKHLLTRKEIDLNFDGKIDVISHFDERGVLAKEELDSDFDGAFDWLDHYFEGKRVMAETDTDFDGESNIFTYYEDGVVTRKERDTDSDGRIDVWERYDKNGKVVKTGTDTTGDGKIDTRTD
jgi:hypothetical protein